ncbi:DNA polymerase IV [Sediminibacterium sp.]|uniref:DNA polymerase IV n=1 Tax=Sediminibacterium sp. TaxID=1917865 RepID=UPI0027357A61|nr:DNA polymerase IV [Sediminibacterium sp.]MDP3392286.1 DNA polymerase IV [Sediminibacterium sp.]MDP3566912.1 DNA polymerase IV [Sediminibacterium sp.]
MQTPQRYIAHLDLDSFFVSVEMLNNPTLKGKAVIVGGSADRGVVTTCSYEARKFGVRSAMPMKTAMKLCPHAILVRGTRGEYTRYSRWVTDIIAAKAPLFEKASIDEFFIDLTGMDKFFDPYQWTIDLRNEIIETTGLPISFGLASNKMIAKIATDEAKPNGYLFVQPGMEKEFLAPLPVNKFSGVGESMHTKLNQMGIYTIEQLSKTPIALLEKVLGKSGADLWKKSQGIHEGIVQPYHESKSISTENTFEENKTDEGFLLSELVRMTEKVAYELRQDGKLTGCIAVKIRYPNFDTTSKQIAISYTLRDDELIPVAIDLFHKLYKKGEPIRLLGVRLSELTSHVLQGSLFDESDKKGDLYKAIDAVKNKFGKGLLQKARTVKSPEKDNPSKG